MILAIYHPQPNSMTSPVRERQKNNSNNPRPHQSSSGNNAVICSYRVAQIRQALQGVTVEIDIIFVIRHFLQKKKNFSHLALPEKYA